MKPRQGDAVVGENNYAYARARVVILGFHRAPRGVGCWVRVDRRLQQRGCMWTVAAARSGMTRVAEANLERQRFEFCSPRVMDERGRLVHLFPRYVIVRVGDQCAEDWRAVNGTKGVQKLLPVHLEEPSALPDGYVEELRERVARMQTVESALEATRNYAKDDLVEIMCGPYAGHVGKFEEKRRGLVKLVMCLLGAQSAVYVPLLNTARAPLGAPVR